MTDDYLLANRIATARDRLEALAAIFDPPTFRHLARCGLAPGWRCWEVGAGGDSVVRWLSAQVGATGHVLATDIDVAGIALPNTDGRACPVGSTAEGRCGSIDVRVHDVGRDPSPAGPFDLVHARLVLVHVKERAAALRTMISSLRPGGWLVIEDADPALQPLGALESLGPEHALANKLRVGFRALMTERGVDLAYGRTLPRLLREAGLVEVGADAYFPVALPACAVLERTTIETIRDRLIAGGHATADGRPRSPSRERRRGNARPRDLADDLGVGPPIVAGHQTSGAPQLAIDRAARDAELACGGRDVAAMCDK